MKLFAPDVLAALRWTFWKSIPMAANGKSSTVPPSSSRKIRSTEAFANAVCGYRFDCIHCEKYMANMYIYIFKYYIYIIYICVRMHNMCMYIYIYVHYTLIPILLIWHTSQKNSGFVPDLFMFWDLGMMMMRRRRMMMMVIINGNRSETCCGSKAPGQGLFGCFWPSIRQLVKIQKLRLGLRELTRNKKNFALGNIDGCPEIDWLFSNWLGT